MSYSQISEEVKARVRTRAKNQCGYCRSLQKYVLGMLEIEHIIPKTRGGSDREDNLWLACRLCNNFKAAQTHGKDPETGLEVKLFNPRHQQWSEHFAWTDDGINIVGKTACDRGTVVALRLNNTYAVMVRQAWVSVGWHPPEE